MQPSSQPKVGAKVRLRLREGVAVGTVLAVDPPQHISWTWDWEAEPLRAPSVVAFDLIDHAERTHLTLRQVGFDRARSATSTMRCGATGSAACASRRRQVASAQGDAKVTQPEP